MEQPRCGQDRRDGEPDSGDQHRDTPLPRVRGQFD
jgi:hypothetical protein